MSFEQFVLQYLEQHGVWIESQRAAIAEAVKADPVNESMADVWQKDVDGYPLSMRAVLGLAINRAAIAWIDEHMPNAFYRPMFTGELD